ncbi:hypothetical protein DLAC_06923 [Tieghemostelium lacteum]|uniref:Transmembrane protein n=1 Tax=Tieghemostelium lacteum TaxID=361077 RepID=A0A151ZDQ3_TIELA|nr:hypothetical protein DLAC_06923 [Tieghemostelium lacteum]|eukprot:KYQ92086.1 hypothetical protein DLAC_06923 [Tieghemostelium lacteum]
MDKENQNAILLDDLGKSTTNQLILNTSNTNNTFDNNNSSNNNNNNNNQETPGEDVDPNKKGKEKIIKLKFSDIFPKKSDISDGIQKLREIQLYKEVLQVSLFSLLEVILIALIGVAYIIGLSYIPYTNTDMKYVETHTNQFYNPYPVASIYFLTLATVVIVIGIGYFLLIFGLKKSLPLIYCTLIPGVALSTLFFVFVAAGVDPWYYALDLPFYGILGVVFFISAKVMAKRVQAPNLPLIFAVPLLVHILIIGIYSFVLFPFYRTINSEVARVAIRILVHPILCRINLIVTQTFVKKYKNLKYPHLANAIVFGILVESALFGRFLIATVGSAKAQVVTSVLSGLGEILLRVAAPIITKLIDYLKNKFLNMKPEIETEIDREHNAQYIINSMVVEKSSILSIPFLLHFFWKHRLVFNFSFGPTPPDLDAMIISAAIQLAIDLTADFISTCGEAIQNIPVIAVWKQSRVKYLIWEILNWLQMCTLIIYVLRTLPSTLYCSSDDPCTCSLFLRDELFYFCNKNSTIMTSSYN